METGAIRPKKIKRPGNILANDQNDKCQSECSATISTLTCPHRIFLVPNAVSRCSFVKLSGPPPHPVFFGPTVNIQITPMEFTVLIYTSFACAYGGCSVIALRVIDSKNYLRLCGLSGLLCELSFRGRYPCACFIRVVRL